MKYMLFESFLTLTQNTSEINKRLLNIGLKNKNKDSEYDFVYFGNNLDYGYALSKNDNKIDVIDSNYRVVDSYSIFDFVDGLRRWGLSFLRTNQKHIKQKKYKKV